MNTTENDNQNELIPKKNRKAKILCCVGVFIAFILGILAFINFKTTLFVTYQVCSAEGVDSEDYMVFRVLESGETRAIYQENLETQIRRDKALAEWEADCASIPDVVSANVSIQNDLMKIWSFVGVDDATYEELRDKLDSMSPSVGLEGVNVSELARYTAQFMASDSYYFMDSQYSFELTAMCGYVRFILCGL